MAYNKEKDRRVTVDLSKDDYKKVDKIAKKTERTVSAMIRVFVRQGLDEYVKKTK